MSEKKIFVWAPFTSKVGTIKNVLNSAKSFNKFSKKNLLKISLINVFGEWSNVPRQDFEEKVDLKELNSASYIKTWKKEGFIKSRISYVSIFISSIVPLFKLLKKEKPQFLVAHLITSLPLLMFTFFNFKTKLILSIAGHPNINSVRRVIWKLSSKKLFKIICPSHELKKKLLELNIFQESKIIVIQDPHLMINKINFLKKENLNDPFLNNGKILISIGRLTNQKNYTFLISNFKKLLLKHNDLKLLIIGDGEQKNTLEKLILRLNIKESVKLIGHKKNVYNYLKQSNFYISTSIWEGSSLAMVDAAYMGLPLLCSDCPSGRKEFIGNDENGFLYNEGSDDSFLEKFEKMYNANFDIIKNQLIGAKKNCKKFTQIKHYINLNNIFFN